MRMSLICNQSMPSSHCYLIPFISSCSPECYSSFLNHSRASSQMGKLGTGSIAQSMLELFKQSNSKSPWQLDPASPIPSCENHNKASCSCFLLVPSASWLTLVLLCAALHGAAWPLLLRTPLLLGTVSSKLLFQWQSIPDLLTSPYLQIRTKFWAHFKTVSWRQMQSNRGIKISIASFTGR